MSKYKSKASILEEQRAKIKQLRLEAADPQAKIDRLAREKETEERHAAIAKDKLEKWMMMKILKGEWDSSMRKKPIDLDDWSMKCSKKGRVSE